jgi:hypothetical protein
MASGVLAGAGARQTAGGHVDAALVPAVVATKLDDARAVVGQSD